MAHVGSSRTASSPACSVTRRGRRRWVTCSAGGHARWRARRRRPGRVHADARGLGRRRDAPARPGLVALDWWNGNRSILVDADLTGLLLGATLATTPGDVYRAFLEATVFGTRVIVEAFESARGSAVDRHRRGRWAALPEPTADAADGRYHGSGGPHQRVTPGGSARVGDVRCGRGGQRQRAGTTPSPTLPPAWRTWVLTCTARALPIGVRGTRRTRSTGSCTTPWRGQGSPMRRLRALQSRSRAEGTGDVR